jgi:hypothetical protein
MKGLKKCTQYILKKFKLAEDSIGHGVSADGKRNQLVTGSLVN